MPILIQPEPNSPLEQGDLLTGIKLYATSGAWESLDCPADLVECAAGLVVSRPCNVAHKKNIIVATVTRFKDSSPKVQASKEILEFLRTVRDGPDCPDMLYLGQIPKLGGGRYHAHLDSLHTVTLPRSAKLQPFLEKNRIARLSGDFARDLHVRAFRAFASLGFDDHGWFSDEDLDWLVNAVRQELSVLELALSRAAADGNEGEKEKVAKDIDKVQTAYKEYLSVHASRISSRGEQGQSE